MLALPSCIGGLQTGCATDGKTIFTNGIDAIRLGSQETHGRQRRPADGRAGGRHQPRTRGPSAGGTSGRGSPRSAARRRSRCSPTSATPSPRASPWPTAWSTSPPWPAASSSPSTPTTGRVLKEIDDRARLVGALRLARPRLRRHRQYAVHARPTPRPSSPRNSPASSTPSACPARTRSIDWARKGTPVRTDPGHPVEGRANADRIDRMKSRRTPIGPCRPYILPTRTSASDGRRGEIRAPCSVGPSPTPAGTDRYANHSLPRSYASQLVPEERVSQRVHEGRCLLSAAPPWPPSMFS